MVNWYLADDNILGPQSSVSRGRQDLREIKRSRDGPNLLLWLMGCGRDKERFSRRRCQQLVNGRKTPMSATPVYCAPCTATDTARRRRIKRRICHWASDSTRLGTVVRIATPAQPCKLEYSVFKYKNAFLPCRIYVNFLLPLNSGSVYAAFRHCIDSQAASWAAGPQSIIIPIQCLYNRPSGVFILFLVLLCAAHLQLLKIQQISNAVMDRRWSSKPKSVRFKRKGRGNGG